MATECDYCEGKGVILAVPPGLVELEEVPCPECGVPTGETS